MKYLVCFLLLLPVGAFAQKGSYADSIVQYRKEYVKDLLADPRGPIKPAQAKGINFFAPDRSFCVWGAFTETPGSVPFMIETHSGKKKPFREYGTVTFSIHDTSLTLHIYQSIDLIKDAAHKDDLFIPFNDETNYDVTFGGGRYLDLSIKDIKNGKLLIDFNKCYNPYCAYADGYSCPLPPVENRLHIGIRAGEQLFVQ